MRRLSPLPRIRRHPEALRLIIRRKRDRHQNSEYERRQLVLAVCRQLRQECKA